MTKHPVAGRATAPEKTSTTAQAAVDLQNRADSHPGVAEVIRAYAMYRVALQAARAATLRRPMGSFATSSTTI